MSYNRIYWTNHRTQLSVKSGLKSPSSIKSAQNHNERKGSEGKGAHIDERRQNLNRDLLDGHGSQDIYLDIINRVTGKEYTSDNVPRIGEETIYYSDGSKLREGKTEKNRAVLAFEAECRYPGNLVWSDIDADGQIVGIGKGEVNEEDVKPVKEGGKGYFMYPLDKDEFEGWCSATKDFLQEKFGKKNVLSMELHMDEDTPHIHTIITPIYETEKGIEKLSYRRYLGDRSDLYDLQTEYAAAVEHLGYKRGEIASPHISNISTKQYKAAMNRAINMELPDTLEEAHKEIRSLRAESFELKIRMEETMKSGRTIQKLRVKNHDLTEENKEQKEQIHRQQVENERLRELLRIEDLKRTIEKRALEIQDPEAAAMYVTLRDGLFKQGKEYLESLGYEINLNPKIKEVEAPEIEKDDERMPVDDQEW